MGSPLNDSGDIATCCQSSHRPVAVRESGHSLTGSRNPLPPKSGDDGGGGGREPGYPVSPAFVRPTGPVTPASRVRYVAELGSGRTGTAYKYHNHEVLDHDRPGGRQLVCRATKSDAEKIAYALNKAFAR